MSQLSSIGSNVSNDASNDAAAKINVDSRNNNKLFSDDSTTWTRTDNNTKVFYTTKDGGPKRSDVYRIITTNMANGQIIEDIDIHYRIDQGLLHPPLPRGINSTRKSLYY